MQYQIQPITRSKGGRHFWNLVKFGEAEPKHNGGYVSTLRPREDANGRTRLPANQCRHQQSQATVGA